MRDTSMLRYFALDSWARYPLLEEGDRQRSHRSPAEQDDQGHFTLRIRAPSSGGLTMIDAESTAMPYVEQVAMAKT
jgi:hypothetical protein